MAAAGRDEIAVFMTSNDSKCAECGEEVIRSGMITLSQHKGALCLACADVDHLVFLSSGDAALTRRARKHSTLSAVVLRWSKARKRYERQGILVAEDAVDKAEEECLSDADVRARRRERESERRNEADELYVERFAAAVREQYPHCPPSAAQRIARHACRKYSGRIGRSAAAKELDARAIELAVIAHVRHAETTPSMGPRLISRGCLRMSLSTFTARCGREDDPHPAHGLAPVALCLRTRRIRLQEAQPARGQSLGR